MAKRVHVAVSRDESVVVLRCYLQNPSNWPCVVEEVTENLHLLPENAREIYKAGTWTWEKLRCRMSDQVTKFSNLDLQTLDDVEIRDLAGKVQAIRRKHAQKRTPEQRKEEGNLSLEKRPRLDASPEDDRQIFVPVSDVDDPSTNAADSAQESDVQSTTRRTSSQRERSTEKNEGAASSVSKPTSTSRLAREANELYVDFARNRLPRLSSMMERCMEKYFKNQ